VIFTAVASSSRASGGHVIAYRPRGESGDSAARPTGSPISTLSSSGVTTYSTSGLLTQPRPTDTRSSQARSPSWKRRTIGPDPEPSRHGRQRSPAIDVGPADAVQNGSPQARTRRRCPLHRPPMADRCGLRMMLPPGSVRRNWRTPYDMSRSGPMRGRPWLGMRPSVRDLEVQRLVEGDLVVDGPARQDRDLRSVGSSLTGRR
jgi:hypothetical protein